MNFVEKTIYNLIKKHPKVKMLVRNIYQAIFDFLPNEKNHFLNDPLIFKNSFFGFHDISPFDPSGNDRILSNRLTDEELLIPNLGKELEVGYYSSIKGSDSFTKLGVSKSWNFHKGCRLQWFDDNSIIYNSLEKGKLISILHNIDSKEDQKFPYPIDSVCYNRDLISTFSYERLEYFMPGYGYKGCVDNGFVEKPIPSETGLKIINLSTKQEKVSISLQELSEKVLTPKKGDFYHYVTHSSFSNDGKYCAFLHRQVNKNELQKRFTTLIIYDLHEDSFYIPETQGMVSHYAWNNDNEIIAYCNPNNIDGHYLISTRLKKCQIIHPRILNSDGHQSFIDNKNFVTDTYPNNRRMSRIFRATIENGKKPEEIVKIYSPRNYQTKDFNNHIACDLHPRVSMDGTLLSFDGVIENRRCHIIMSLENHG
jgi:hypothetical protein